MPNDRNEKIFKLRDKGLSYNRIAVLLGITRNVVAGVIHRDNRPALVPALPPRPGRKLELRGKKIGRLSVIVERGISRNDGGVLWECRCECGEVVIVRATNLRCGQTQSCGCLQRERVGEANRRRFRQARFGAVT